MKVQREMASLVWLADIYCITIIQFLLYEKITRFSVAICCIIGLNIFNGVIISCQALAVRVTLLQKVRLMKEKPVKVKTNDYLHTIAEA